MIDVEVSRIVFFLATILLCALWEVLLPDNTLQCSKLIRWLNNFSLSSLNTLIIKLFIPVLAFQVANEMSELQIGLLNLLPLPSVLSFLFSILVLDFAIYWQHRIFHLVPSLWAIHRVHHADRDVDISTGVRFHPIEIILSFWIKLGVVVLMGVSPIAIVAFEVILSSSSIYTHSNAKLNDKLDRWLKYLLVTPNMHRIHHSTEHQLNSSNFGFFLSVWDHWFGTYLDTKEHGFKIGLQEFRDKREMWIDRLLSQPFRKS
ncbi:sterol desaturase family protein [Vibrio sp. S4M6]|uniref:sterol desaturase family protein n=1 Tax=Vibrio sinus TaxID=2946865 RepID=UPI00202A1A6E|nr:sterol desaturase family protein [Vibrio sinus]MCL9783296.1 sterol desaturase family protein [Vibrio sinus]